MKKPRTKPQRTQYFAALLATLMERNGINQVQLAAATGIAVSRVNNYLQGKYRTIRPDHLGLLAKAAGRNVTDRGELVCAYVKDLLPEELHGVIRLEVAGDAGKPAKHAPAAEKSLLPTTALAALTELQAMSVRNAKARARMQWFTEILSEVNKS
jgi:transcriptional regulator with XRE-family HTH domain